MNPQHQFNNQDSLFFLGNTAAICFAGPRKVLSTAHWNGGYRTDLWGVFNMDEKITKDKRCIMLADTYEKHLEKLAERYLQEQWPDAGKRKELLSHIAGLTTAVDIKNTVICAESEEEYTVTAIATAGAEGNAIRVGESMDWRESEGLFTKYQPGTINILLHIDTNLQEGAMATALMAATEAKTAVLQKRKTKSCYSDQIATGTGTDGVIIIADSQGSHLHHYASTYCKMGECIGKTVTRAVDEALDRHLATIHSL